VSPRRPLRVLPAAALAAGVASCSPHKVPDKVAPPVDLLDSFSEAGKADAPDRWWRSFDDPDLDALVEQALGRNLGLREAAARLAQSWWVSRRTGADLWPQFDLEYSIRRERVKVPATEAAGAGAMQAPVPGPGGGGAAQAAQQETRRHMVNEMQETQSLGITAAYELDLWRRIRSLRDASTLDAEASREDLHALAITLAGNVADTWYGVVEQRAQLKLNKEQIETSRKILGVLELRFGKAQSSALDVYQQRTQLATVKGQRPPIQSRLEVLEHQLAVLLGRPPGKAPMPDRAKLPLVPPLPKTGVPAALLQRRPDVRAAHTRLVAADHRVAAAMADQLPAIRLTAESLYRGRTGENMFDSWTWNIGAGLVQPLFDGGRRAAETGRTRAVVAERLHAYGGTVLHAFQEVEDALSQEREQVAFLVSLAEQVRLSETTLKVAGRRYRNGMTDFLNVLTALQTLQNRQRDLLVAERQRITYRIQLYRALGGAWPKTINAARLATTTARTTGEDQP
jgi:NodT family efflux transporter outer membrane factor (OMF) lipoprotein